jgi:hypothetical protein
MHIDAKMMTSKWKDCMKSSIYGSSNMPQWANKVVANHHIFQFATNVPNKLKYKVTAITNRQQQIYKICILSKEFVLPQVEL